MPESFKGFWSEGGLWICVRPEIGRPGWIVRVYNFATWKHKTLTFETEKEARTEAVRWML